MATVIEIPAAARIAVVQDRIKSVAEGLADATTEQRFTAMPLHERASYLRGYLSQFLSGVLPLVEDAMLAEYANKARYWLNKPDCEPPEPTGDDLDFSLRTYMQHKEGRPRIIPGVGELWEGQSAEMRRFDAELEEGE